MQPQTGPILIIKLGALGDIVLATGAFQAIRRHHDTARITLLTTAAFDRMARLSGYFDDVWVVDRPSKSNLWALWRIARRIRWQRFSRVYDLQRNDITTRIFRMISGRKPEWNGIAPGCSHPHIDPKQHVIHTIERQKGQLAAAGIAEVPDTDISWLTDDVSGFALQQPYALLVPGGSAARPNKRWPADRYMALARQMADHGIQPVLIGGPDEQAVLDQITALEPRALNLGGRTNFAQIARLARGARNAVGNDTGPIHLIAAAGCDCVVLFSSESDPSLTAPRGVAGGRVTVLRRARLDDLPIVDVWDAVSEHDLATA